MPPFSTNRDQYRVTLTTPDLTLAFSIDDGGLRELRRNGGPNLLGHGKPISTIDVRLNDRGWLADRLFVRYLRHTIVEHPHAIELVITTGVGPLVADDRYWITGTLIARQMTIANVGEDSVQLFGLRLLLPWARVGELDACRFDAPGNSVRPHMPLAEVAAQQPWRGAGTPRSAHTDLLGGLDRAPTQGPGVLALHDPTSDDVLFCWFYSDIDTARPSAEGNGLALTLTHEVDLAEWLHSEERLRVGTQFVLLLREPWPAALGALERTWALYGIHNPDRPALWMRDAAIYETHPALFGGFQGLAAALPSLCALGLNTLCLMPIWEFANLRDRMWDGNWEASGNPYAVRDFERLDSTLGDERDFDQLIAAAHAQGMRVLIDLPLEGCAADATLVAQHPNWFCYDTEGQLQRVSMRPHLVAYDWTNSDLHTYILDWAVHHLQRYQPDGFRIVLPRMLAPHWQRALGARNSPRALIERLRHAMQAARPEAALLCALGGPLYHTFSDAALDEAAHHMFMHLALSRITPAELGEWLEDHARTLPQSVTRVCFTEYHHTRLVSPLADGLRGSRLSRMLLAGMVLCGFVPLIGPGQEQADREQIAQLLQARAGSSALRYGAAAYNSLPCSSPQVFAVLRLSGDERLIGLLNVGPHRHTVTISLPVDRIELPEDEYQLFELFGRHAWAEEGRHSWSRDDLLSLHLTLEPFGAYCLSVRQAPQTNGIEPTIAIAHAFAAPAAPPAPARRRR